MSEYNKFLKQFNQSNNPDKAEASENEDIIPVKNAEAKFSEHAQKTDENNTLQNSASEEKEQTVKDAKDGENTFDGTVSESDTAPNDTLPSVKFIKTDDTPFISATQKDEELATSSQKYTDRFLPKIPERKINSEHTGKINTYAVNHSPNGNAPKILTEEKQEDSENTKTAEEVKSADNSVLAEKVKAAFDGKTKVIPSLSAQNENSDSQVETEKSDSTDKTEKGETKHINAKSELLRELAKSSVGTGDDSTPTSDELPDNEAKEEPSSVDEDLATELSGVREKRIKSFRFWTKQEVATGESEDKSFNVKSDEKQLPEFLRKTAEKFSYLDTDFTPVGEDEYTDPSKRKEIFSKLIGIRKKVIYKALILGVLGIVLLGSNIAVSVSAAMNKGFFTLFGGSTVVYNTLSLVILVIAGIIMFDDLKKGLFSILKIRPKTDSALLFMYLAALTQNIASYFTVLKPESDYHLLSGAAVVLCVPVLVAKIFYYDSIRHCFKAVAATSDKCYLRKVSDENLAASLIKERSETETDIVYAGKTRFISGFLKRSAKSAFAGQASSRITACAMAIALLAGIVALFTTGSIVNALGGIVFVASLSFPVGCAVFTGYALSSENSALSVKSSYIESYSASYGLSKIDDIIIDGNDIFSVEVTGVSVREGVSEKQARFCADVLTNKAGGILKKAFADASSGFEDKYPDVEYLVYEDKLGFSAWISDCKVLFGTKELLLNHDVELPEEHTVPFVISENEKPLFLALEGHFAAVFSVKYSCDEKSCKVLRDLTQDGTNIIINIQDPNITEEFGEKLLSLPENSLRTFSDATAEKFAVQKNTVTDSEETGIVFSDSYQAFIRTLAGGIKLNKLKRTAKIFCEAGCIAGAVFGLLLCILGAKSGISSWLSVLIQFFWLAVSFFAVPAVAATTLKKNFFVPENISERVGTILSKEDTEEFYDSLKEKTEETNKEDVTASNVSAEKPTSAVNNIADDTEKTDKTSDFAIGDEAYQKAIAEAKEFINANAVFDMNPEKVNFSGITGEEDTDIYETQATEQTISDDILDSFATQPTRRTRETNVSSQKTNKRKSFRTLLGGNDKEEGISDAKKSGRRSIISFADEKIAPPPRFDDEKEKDDFPKASFVPPENDAPSLLYNDDFFASYDPKEDDKAFADIRKQREENGGDDEFDFWPLKK